MGDVASGFFDTGHGAFPVCLSLSLSFKPSLSLSLSLTAQRRARGSLCRVVAVRVLVAKGKNTHRYLFFRYGKGIRGSSRFASGK